MCTRSRKHYAGESDVGSYRTCGLGCSQIDMRRKMKRSSERNLIPSVEKKQEAGAVYKTVYVRAV